MTDFVKLTRMTALLASMAVVSAALLPGAALAGATTALISQSDTGGKGNAESSEPGTSGTGRYVVFNSFADNLVRDDNNGEADCFVRDQVSGTTERVSVASDGTESNGKCWGPAISQDGKWVAFGSDATNLGGSTNGITQIYLHNRETGVTRLVSERASGGQGGNAMSHDPSISRDGRYIVFESKAGNLINGDTNGKLDIYLYDRTTGQTKRVSVRSNGKQANGGSTDPSISANGKFIVFTSAAKNLVTGDTNRKRDVFIHNRVTKKTVRVSVRSGGGQANGASWNATVSGDGHYVAYESKASNLVRADGSADRDVFVYNRWKKKVSQVSLTSTERQARGDSADPTISNNGRWVAFESIAGNLAKGDKNKKWDAFVRDTKKGTTKIVSKRSDGKIAWGNQDDPFISGDGRFVAFESTARNMVPADTDTIEDIFRRGPLY